MEQRPDPLWRQRPARSRKRVVAILVSLVAVYVAFIAVKAPGSCGAPGGGPCGAAISRAVGARFDVRVTPRAPVPLPICHRRERKYYEPGDSLIREACITGHADWYHAVVTYHGAARWVACTLVGYDAGGRRLWSGTWGMPMLPVVPAPVAVAVRMHAGQTLTVDFHLPSVSQGGPPGPVARYVAHCQTLAGEPS
jgi:hypothetical protein